VFPGEGETLDAVSTAAKEAVDDVPAAFRNTRRGFGELAFDNVQQTAIHGLYAALEEGSDRDERLAGYALANRDPSDALAGEFRGLREMTGDNAAELAAEYFSAARATVVTLKANERKTYGQAVS